MANVRKGNKISLNAIGSTTSSENRPPAYNPAYFTPPAYNLVDEVVNALETHPFITKYNEAKNININSSRWVEVMISEFDLKPKQRSLREELELRLDPDQLKLCLAKLREGKHFF